MTTSFHQLLQGSIGVVTSSEEKHKKSRHRSDELLWKDFFRDPSHWWDNRNTKRGPTHPDFRHKFTKQPLWVDSWYTPSWVAEELRRINKAIDDVGTAHFALPQSQVCETHDNAFHSESIAFVASLRACTKNKDLYKGTRLHDDILRKGLLEECSDALVTMYAKCGMLDTAKELLGMHKSRDVISWTALIAGYARQGRSQDALDCFECMQLEGLSPNAVTFASILKACGNLRAADKGKQIHDEIVRQGLLGHDVVLGNALIDMYAKCNALAKAQGVLEELSFRNVVSWSTLIAGYAQQGQGEQALDCFECMQGEGLHPDAMTYACILKACGILGATDKGEQIHDDIARQGLLQNDVVLGTALVDMYAKCGDLAKAAQVLEELPSRNVTSWNALITGYAQQGQGQQALNCFEKLQLEGFNPNAVTFLCVLNVCSHLGLVEYGHMYFVDMSTKYGVNPELEHYCCMVDLFGRAGHLDKAVGVIQEMPSSHYSAVLSTLLGACRKWGDVKVARWAFEHAVQVNKSDALAYVLMADMYAAAGMQKDAEIIEAMRMSNKAWRRPEQVH